MTGGAFVNTARRSHDNSASLWRMVRRSIGGDRQGPAGLGEWLPHARYLESTWATPEALGVRKHDG